MKTKLKKFYYFIKDFAKVLLVSMVVFCLYVLIARLIFQLPTIEHIGSMEYKQKNISYLKNHIDKYSMAHENLTGIKVLAKGIEAFTARMMLIKSATHTIDIQYYIWHKDLTGLLMLSALEEAADRGVRVRLLLDDNGIGGLDPIINELNQHKMIEIRLYNPFVFRAYKPLNFTFDFFRLNRRMHNKVFIVDDAVAISGGRNIGDEYFGIGEQPQFLDLDILTVGEVMPSMVNNFNFFYTSVNSIPSELLIDLKESKNEFSYLKHALSKFEETERNLSYSEAIETSHFIQDIQSELFIEEWTDVKLISDVPSKTLNKHHESQLVVNHLTQYLNATNTRLDLITPYFIPVDEMSLFKKLTNNTVKVRVLTNSFEATDSPPVHIGYAEYRHALLSMGVEIFEFKAQASNSKRSSENSGFSDSSMGGSTLGKSGGSSGSSLHAKSFAIDEKLVFIGSLNFDPRSINLNTEMGVLIQSKQLAQNIHSYFDDSMKQNTYKLSLNETGGIIWSTKGDNKISKTYHHDPNTSLLQRMIFKIMAYVPIEWLL